MSRYRPKPWLIYVVFFAILAASVIYLYQADVVHVNRLASTVTAVSLIFAPLWYFIKRHISEVEERTRTRDNLISELEDTLMALDSSNSDSLREIRIQGTRFFFMNRMFNHDFYDSLVSSGKINFVSRDVQQPIQDVYHSIRDHNAHLQKIRDVEDEPEGTPDLLEPHYKLLDYIEHRLAETIRPAIKKLEGVD